VAARGGTPQDRPCGCVDRERPAIGRRHEEGVVPGAVHRDAAQIDRRGIDRTVEDDAMLLELAHVGRRDPGPGRPRVVAGRVIAETSPVPTEVGRRGARLHRGAGARAAASREEAYDPKYRKEPAVHPEIVPERPYVLTLVREAVQAPGERNGIERAIRGLTERRELGNLARLAPILDGLAARDPQTPEDAGAVVAVEVATLRRRHSVAAVDIAARHRAVAACVAIHLDGPDERALVAQP